MPVKDNWKPGNRCFEYLELDEYLKCLKVRVPVHGVVGTEDGPTLYVQACQHGTEINGWEAGRQVLEFVAPETLRGTLIVVPVGQPVAFQARMHDYPDSTHNMNRTWPGQADGPFIADRLADMVFQQIVMKSDAVVDFHCWAATSVPMAWSNPGNRAYVEAFGSPYFYENSINRETPKLENACHDVEIPYVAIEMMPQDWIDLESVRLGRTGTLNLMRWMGMIDGPMEYPPQRFVFKPGPQDHLVSVGHEGMWVPSAKQFTVVKEGDVLGHVYDWETYKLIEEIVSPVEAFVYGLNPDVTRGNINLVEPGDQCACLFEVETILTPEDGPAPGAWSK